MSEYVADILNKVATVLAAIAIVFALLLVGGKPFGFHAYAVTSGSMEPEYPTGSLIYVKETPTSELDEGDVITYMLSKDSVATHRIVDVVEGEDGETRFQTKGDANSNVDSKLVHPDNVIGTPVLTVPVLGYAVAFVQQPPGTYLAIVALAVIVMLMFIPDLLEKDEEDEEENPAKRAKGAHRQPRALPAPHASHAANTAPQNAQRQIRVQGQAGRVRPMHQAGFSAAQPQARVPRPAQGQGHPIQHRPTQAQAPARQAVQRPVQRQHATSATAATAAANRGVHNPRNRAQAQPAQARPASAGSYRSHTPNAAGRMQGNVSRQTNPGRNK